jgi:hypothetical protein
MVLGALMTVPFCSAAEGQDLSAELNKSLLKIQEQRSLYRGIEYEMTQERRRTQEGIHWLVTVLPEGRVQRIDEPEALEKRVFHRVSAGEKKYLKSTHYSDDGATILGSLESRWNGSTGSQYNSIGQQGRLSLKSLESDTEDLMESMFLVLEGKRLDQWIEDPKSEASAFEKEGLVHVEFKVTEHINAKYTLDPKKGMLPTGYRLLNVRGETVKEGRVDRVLEIETIGGSVYFPVEYVHTFWVDPGYRPARSTGTTDGGTIPTFLPHIPLTETRCQVESISLDPAVGDEFFEPNIPDGASVYDEVLGRFVNSSRLTASFSEMTSDLLAMESAIADAAHTVRDSMDSERESASVFSGSEAAGSSHLRRLAVAGILIIVATLIVWALLLRRFKAQSKTE